MIFIKAFILKSTVLVAAVCVILYLVYSPQKENSIDKENIFRLHIIANSDSETDQHIKLCVRDAVLNYEKDLFDSASINNAKETKNILMQNAKDICSITSNVLQTYGASYGLKLSTGTYSFPDKTYMNTTYPAGEYSALRIVLGDGVGKNWWCVMFPPLCIIDETSGQIEAKETLDTNNKDIQFKSLFVKLYRLFIGIFD